LKTLLKTFNRLCFSLGSSLLLFSCTDDKTDSPKTDIQKNSGVFVANEGTFTFGNASLFYINLDKDSLSSQSDIFKQVNNRPLGDILQSLALIDEKLWLIVNNSGKIEIVEPSTGLSINSIRGLKSPRYALQVSPSKVYVTDLYSQHITVINPQSYAVIGSIKCAGWTEELISHDGKVWVCNHDREYLYVIDPTKDIVTDSIKVAYGGSSILKDKNGMIWILCSGDETKNKIGGLFGINSNSATVSQKWLFDNSAFNPVKLKQNPNQDSLYFVFKGIFGFPKTTALLPANPFIIQESGSSFYGLTIEPIRGDLLVADAIDYQSKGYVRIYSANGKYKKKFQVGVNPGEFLNW
jgi:hypothetical protein